MRKPLPLMVVEVEVPVTKEDGAMLVTTGGGAVAEVTVNAFFLIP